MTKRKPDTEQANPRPAAEVAAAEAQAEADAEASPQPGPDGKPDDLIRVRWDGPEMAVPDFTAAIRSHHPDRRPATLHRGDILEIRRRDRTDLHADTTSTEAPAVNVPKGD